MIPLVNSFFYLDFFPLKLHIPVHFPLHYFTSSLLHTQSRPQDPTAHPTASLPDLPLPTPPHPCLLGSPSPEAPATPSGHFLVLPPA